MKRSSDEASPAPYSKEMGSKVFPKTGKRGAPQAFAYILFELVEHESDDVISWSADGKGFKIEDIDKFTSSLLQKYYRHENFPSFQRQLNLYGFRKLKQGPYRGSYFHPSFVKNKRELLSNVKRPRQAPKKAKRQKGERTAAQESGEATSVSALDPLGQSHPSSPGDKRRRRPAEREADNAAIRVTAVVKDSDDDAAAIVASLAHSQEPSGEHRRVSPRALPLMFLTRRKPSAPTSTRNGGSCCI